MTAATSPVPRALRIVLPLGTAAALILVWSAGVRITGTRILPTPAEVGRTILSLATTSTLWRHAGSSLGRVFTGYLAAIAIGLPLGFAMGMSRTLTRALNPLMQMLRPISPLAWTPLAVIWFGVGTMTPVFLIFMAAVFPIALSAMNALRDVPQMYVQAGRNFGLTTPQIVTRIVVPAALPRIAAGLRLAFGIAWVVLVAAEMIAVDSGLGYLVIDARNAGKRYDLVIAGMLLIGLIGLAIDSAFRRIEIRLTENS